MKRIIGMVIGVFYAVLSGLAFTSSTGNWSAGNSDLGLSWAIIGSLLGIACLGAVLGTWFHTRPAED
jgi:heme A synthase